jgi:hypothetical protein
MDKVTKIIDEGSNADIFYLDFAKAFDKVPHEKLIIKLESKGINGKVKRWIKNWLTDRSQRVVLGEEESESSKVESGMPQGTILGPPLFTIHIDDIDIEMLLAELAVKFADDTKGVKRIESEQDKNKLQTVFDNLFAWSLKWGMELNVAKCKVMHVGRSNPEYKYNIRRRARGGGRRKRYRCNSTEKLKTRKTVRKSREHGGGGPETNNQELSLQGQESICKTIQTI